MILFIILQTYPNPRNCSCRCPAHAHRESPFFAAYSPQGCGEHARPAQNRIVCVGAPEAFAGTGTSSFLPRGREKCNSRNVIFFCPRNRRFPRARAGRGARPAVRCGAAGREGGHGIHDPRRLLPRGGRAGRADAPTNLNFPAYYIMMGRSVAGLNLAGWHVKIEL